MKTLVLLHLTVSTLFILIFYKKIKYKAPTIACLLIVLAFPVGGAIIVYLLYLTNLEFSSLKSRYDLLGYFDNENKNFRFVNKLNIEEETKVIPVQKALIEEDYKRRREVVLNLIKKDVNKYTSLMNMALLNEDSETSHYAASSILHSKRKLDNSMNRMSELYMKNKNNPTIIISYSDQLMEFIHNEYLDKDIKEAYIEDGITILERIVNENLDSHIRHISNLINLLVRTGNFDKAYIYTDILAKNYNNTEEKYLLLLESFYSMRDFRKFNIALRKFISSDITFSKDAINVVRFWLGG